MRVIAVGVEGARKEEKGKERVAAEERARKAAEEERAKCATEQERIREQQTKKAGLKPYIDYPENITPESWVLVDKQKDTWLSVVERKFVGHGNPKEYRAYYCQICEMEIPETSVHWSKKPPKIPFHRTLYSDRGRHPLKMSIKHPTCEVYACPICGMPSDPALNGYCSNTHRNMMLRRLKDAALSVDLELEKNQ